MKIILNAVFLFYKCNIFSSVYNNLLIKNPYFDNKMFYCFVFEKKGRQTISHEVVCPKQ